ncbi:MAG TPA: (E)-4-hydroxy-3-methylbut-2-enyl-diphosphate synthase [Candidatus Egerieousia sp.]|nr:(E)-4-hydroxy-3-methylbut-2-enyl-diphosphate synthase [Candidatus Egerieousia sp.]HPT05329.1 (E)-4-hydroxy-3-methylbut-2-enyl-diphosphate synthase [Candidatus Egerieousia sp.]
MNKLSVKIKDIVIGGNSPIVVQTMCNTHTQDIEASVAQCKDMAAAGAQMIRLTTQGLDEVKALQVIKEQLHAAGIHIPLIADVHFNSDVALAAAKVADKVRINPGNFAQVHKDAEVQFKKFLEICKENNTAVRIGLNHGSLGEEIVNKYGNTPLGMKEAVMQWLSMCKENEFYNVVVSLKASNTVVMTEAYRLLHKAMQEDGMLFPLHLGVTEAGNGDQGRIKSAVGIGALLKDGIGDTIRVSLTENPVNEIYAGHTIANFFESGENEIMLDSVMAQIRSGLSKPEAIISVNPATYSYNSTNATTSTTSNNNGININDYLRNAWNEFIIKASCLFGPLLLDKQIDDFDAVPNFSHVHNHNQECEHANEHSHDNECDDAEGKISVEMKKIFSADRLAEFKKNLMQAARRKFTHPEYIACPGCGRTQYNLEQTFNEVKRRTAHLKGLKIAVMGCIVNGPGEMADADYGYVGQGGHKVTIYKGKTPVLKSVPEDQAIDALIKIISES